ncbi:hypothetical protein KR026_011072, partial [Drosophila bipectinata]
ISQIVEFLDIEEQLQLWQATESTSRLNSVVAYAWQRQSKHSIHRETFDDRPQLLEDFLQAIRSSVVELTLNYLPMSQLELWRKHIFPNIRELYYMGDEDGDADVDSEVEILLHCFPLVESIGLGGNCSGRYIDQFRNLRRLDLQLCWFLSTQCFENICRNLPLQTLNIQWRRADEDAYVRAISTLHDLEELELEIVHLAPENIPQLINLPKLRKLRIHNFDQLDDLLSEIGGLRGQDVVAATCKDSIWTRTPGVLAKLHNLRSLTIIDDEGCCAIDFSVIYHCFPRLEQIHLENSRIWPNADGIWDVVDACPHLTDFTISNMVLYEEFFAFSASTMNRILDRREKTLVLHLNENEMESLICERFVHPKLKLSFEPTSDASSSVPEEWMELELLPKLS